MRKNARCWMHLITAVQLRNRAPPVSTIHGCEDIREPGRGGVGGAATGRNSATTMTLGGCDARGGGGALSQKTDELEGQHTVEFHHGFSVGKPLIGVR